jgi:hypothetical protein
MTQGVEQAGKCTESMQLAVAHLQTQLAPEQNRKQKEGNPDEKLTMPPPSSICMWQLPVSLTFTLPTALLLVSLQKAHG